MKYLGGLVIGLMIFSIGCSTSTDEDVFSEIEQFNTDLELIDNWITLNGIADTLHHESEIRYTVNTAGTGDVYPERYDVIKISYEGRYLESGIVFDSGTNFETVLSRTIYGWQIMVQDMREGDEFTIYLPSLYAYGRYGNGIIPPSSVLVFDIKLIRIGI